jgi:hypothetical protein
VFDGGVGIWRGGSVEKSSDRGVRDLDEGREEFGDELLDAILKVEDVMCCIYVVEFVSVR